MCGNTVAGLKLEKDFRCYIVVTILASLLAIQQSVVTVRASLLAIQQSVVTDRASLLGIQQSVVTDRASLLAIQQSVVTVRASLLRYTTVCSDGPIIHCTVNSVRNA